MSRVAIMGAGSWGTAFAMLCHEAGREPVLWARRRVIADEINTEHTNAAYLPGIELPPSLTATDEPEEALRGAELVVVVIPSMYVEEQLQRWGRHIPEKATVVSLIKGVQVTTRRLGSEIIADALDCNPDRVVVVSGPNLARECARGLPTATVAACPDLERAEQVQRAVMGPSFRVYTNPDKVGVEIGGAVKNVIALAAGVARGMGLGDNAGAAVITRGLAEMQRLGVAMGGRPLTFSGLAGIGDLVVTCTSEQSRNNTVGIRLGQGMAVEDILAGMNGIAEGVRSSRAIVELAREHDAVMPLAEGVVRIVHEGLDPTTILKELLARSAKPELYGLDRD